VDLFAWFIALDVWLEAAGMIGWLLLGMGALAWGLMGWQVGWLVHQLWLVKSNFKLNQKKEMSSLQLGAFAERSDRHCDTLIILSQSAPLLGLLGTVGGMMITFESITQFGVGDPTVMAQGISKALLTTQAGLLVAIPVLLGVHFMEFLSARLLNLKYYKVS
jgi:hypothetical protein